MFEVKECGASGEASKSKTRVHSYQRVFPLLAPSPRRQCRPCSSAHEYAPQSEGAPRTLAPVWHPRQFEQGAAARAERREAAVTLLRGEERPLRCSVRVRAYLCEVKKRLTIVVKALCEGRPAKNTIREPVRRYSGHSGSWPAVGELDTGVSRRARYAHLSLFSKLL
jgi:hypothetical protein